MLLSANDAALHQQLQHLARTQRSVFFAGLPGMGKSLLLQQLAHIASLQGRSIFLLQWDVARPVFEANPAAQLYPSRAGVTHSVIRKAVGLWARHAVLQWYQKHPETTTLLIGEAPLIGQRFLDLAYPQDDPSEVLLAAGSFVIPVLSREVRNFVEHTRQQRSRQPLHPGEREDASPALMQALWQQLVAAAIALNLAPASTSLESSYDPDLYYGVYRHLLRHRQVQCLSLTTVLPTATQSVYSFSVPKHDIVPTAAEVTTWIHVVEQRYPDRTVLENAMEQWYRCL